MSRETCIQHRPHNRLAIVREDYFALTGDAVAAALLNYFEYRANSALAPEAEPENMASINIGPISIAEFQTSLLGLSTDKQIRKRLAYLAAQGAITCPDTRQGKTPNYTVEISHIQSLLQGDKSAEKFGQTTSVKQPRSNNLGQITEPLRSNDQTNLGQITEPLRSNDRYSLYKNKEVDQSVRATPEKAVGVSSDIARFEAQFRPQENPPWVVSRQGNVRQYDKGFKSHVIKYLSKLGCYKGQVVDDFDATKWLNAANYTSKPEGQKRLADVWALWEDYQAHLAKKPARPTTSLPEHDGNAVGRDVMAHTEWVRNATTEQKKQRLAEIRAARSGGYQNVSA